MEEEAAIPAARTRSQLLRERRRAGGSMTSGRTSPSLRSPPRSPVPDSSQPLVELIANPEAKETATRIQALLARSCSSEAQRQRVLAAAVDRARSPQRAASSSPAGSRLVVGGGVARIEPPSQRLMAIEAQADNPRLMALEPRIKELAGEVESLHKKLDVLKEKLGQGVKAAFENADTLEVRVVELEGLSEAHEKRIKAVETAAGLAASGGNGSSSSTAVEKAHIAADSGMTAAAGSDTSRSSGGTEGDGSDRPRRALASSAETLAETSEAPAAQSQKLPEGEEEEEEEELAALVAQNDRADESPKEQDRTVVADSTELDLAGLKRWCEAQLAQMHTSYAASMVQILEHGSEQKAQSERVAALEKGQTALQTELAALKELVATQAGQLSAAHERIDATLGTE
jgi:hypothetical protein